MSEMLRPREDSVENRDEWPISGLTHLHTAESANSVENKLSVTLNVQIEDFLKQLLKENPLFANINQDELAQVVLDALLNTGEMMKPGLSHYIRNIQTRMETEKH